jgi:hypothetical protein
MARLTIGLAAWISLVSLAAASLTPRKATARLGGDVRTGQGIARWAGVTLERPSTLLKSNRPPTTGPEQADHSANPLGPGVKSEFVLTTRTEVRVDGKPCQYEKVPAGATIILMELAPDNKTVLKIHFRTAR